MSSYLLKIALRGTPNLIWRRFVVPPYTPLSRLHRIIQTVMGWRKNLSHTFVFRKQVFYSVELEKHKESPEEAFSLDDIVCRAGAKLRYVYDPAESNWVHDITVESIRYLNPLLPSPIYCLEGVRACPPEFCNGADDFTDFIKALSSPNHPQHGKMKIRFGSFDPDFFDIEKVNKVLLTGCPVPGKQITDRKKFAKAG